jgi:D-glycero-beta-D-manno-heptose 1-phosphate adenylyltransferase
MRSKILDREQARAWVADQHSKGKKVGFTCGAFDILHVGHVEYLRAARAHCDCLLVAINSDKSIQTYKHPLRPLNRERHRMEVVAALEVVDAVTLMEETRPSALIRLLKPEIYIKGGDYSAENLRSKPLVESYGGKVVCIPVNTDISTSDILERAALLDLHERAPHSAKRDLPRLIFLDRDGTLIRDIPFLHDASRVELLPGVLDGLRDLQRAGFTLVMITNQQGIGLGYYTETEFIQVNQALLRQLAPAGIKISRIYYCPHSLADDCECRKPGKLLLEKALRHFGAEPGRCYMIGDSPSDCQAATSVGCRSVLVAEESPAPTSCTHLARSFYAAVQWILTPEREANLATL